MVCSDQGLADRSELICRVVTPVARRFQGRQRPAHFRPQAPLPPTRNSSGFLREFQLNSRPFLFASVDSIGFEQIAEASKQPPAVSCLPRRIQLGLANRQPWPKQTFLSRELRTFASLASGATKMSRPPTFLWRQVDFGVNWNEESPTQD